MRIKSPRLTTSRPQIAWLLTKARRKRLKPSGELGITTEDGQSLTTEDGQNIIIE